MAVDNVYRDIALANATKQTEMVDNLLEEAPLLAGMPMQPSSHGFQNVFEEIESVTGAGLIDIDGELPSINADGKLAQTDLSILGGTMFVGEDKAQKMGGASAYFASKLPLILNKTGSDVELSLIYNNIRSYTIEQNKWINAGGTGTANFTVLAVTWKRGEVTGLYDPTGYGDGKVFDVEPVNGGNLYEKTIDGKVTLGYGVRIKSTIGIQLANPRYVASIVNIDLDAGTPKPMTERMMDKVLLDCRANQSTVLYMHPRALTELYNYKSSRLQMIGSETDVNRVVAFWNGTPIITTYNFLNGTEPTVS